MSGAVRWPIPDWLERELPSGPLRDREARMSLAIHLAERNVAEDTGGPFAAVLYERGSGGVLTAGVDLISSAGCSSAHAEIVAIARAQAELKTPDLRTYREPLELHASATPCTMCLGAVVWSGVSALVYAARDEDWNEAWDDLPKPDDWQEQMARRGVRVTPEVLREEARRPLRAYIERLQLDAERLG